MEKYVRFVTTAGMELLLNRPVKSRYLVLLAVIYLALQSACIEIFPAHAMAVSYPFIILAPWFALSVCWKRVRVHAIRTKLLWTLLCAGLAIWGVGILFAAWEDLSQHNTLTVAYFSDFLFFLYGMPVLLAISSPTQSEQNPLCAWLDALQVLMTAFLTYVAVFSVLPFIPQSGHPLSFPRLLLTYNLESLALAGTATLRLLAYTNDGEERRFYKILCSFLWVYALCTGIYNHITMVTNEHTGLYDLLTTFPFLFLALGAVFLFGQREKTIQSSRRRALPLFIDNASPIFFTMALLALGAMLVREHFYVGMSGIVVALAVYGIRATFLQSRYMDAQHELQTARDMMEAMSLTDSLTGVANRRCFDHTLDVEWRRAVRSRSPLSMLMIDVDYFKNLNDSYGHPYGDDCLMRIATSLQSALPRSADLLARYGGEEFAVILSATEIGGAEIVALRMQEFVHALNLRSDTPIGLHVTISIGVATYEFPHSGSPGSLIEAADRALYLAKRRGRDRIEYASETILAESDR